MIVVFLVDGKTRLHLPDSKWGVDVRNKLREMGHIVQRTSQPEFPDLRCDAERHRRYELLASTGL